MFSLCYVSKLTQDFTEETLPDFIDEKTVNHENGVTGYLNVKRDYVFQYLEGEKEDVQAMMEIIANDEKHSILRELKLTDIDERRFADWRIRYRISDDGIDITLTDLLENVMRSMATPLFKEERIIELVLSLLEKLSHRARNKHSNTKGLHASVENRSSIKKSINVFGIGASAGGLEPLSDLLETTPADINAALVVVQHLSPDYDTLLSSILRRHTTMDVLEIEQGMAVERGNVYLIPPGMNVVLKNDRFDLSKQDRLSKVPQFPINLLFESLAKEYGPQAVGVVLSGTGTDGMLGAGAIYESGGIVLAQSQDSAEFDGMPRAVIESGSVHEAIPPAAIAARLTKISKIGSRSQSSIGLEINSEALDLIVAALTDDSVDFSHYKRETIFRCVERRRILAEKQGFYEYLKFLESSKTERVHLRKDLLISVTNFFRDESAWDDVENSVIPKIAENLPDGDVIRVWVAGCATGEEAYSFAILLSEYIEKSKRDLDFKIYATDLSNDAVDFATAGIYPESAVQLLSQKRREKFFKESNQSYLISKDIRERVIVNAHNMVKDTPFTHVNIASCRNVLIYMDQQLQQQVLKVLHHALVVGGKLFLGSSESLGAMQSEFRVHSQEWNIFEKIRESKLPLHLSSNLLHAPGGLKKRRKKPVAKAPVKRNLHEEMLGLISESMQKTLIMIDESRKVQMVGQDPKGLLQVKTGTPSSDVADMVLDGLGPTLTIAIQHALQENRTVRYSGLRCRNKNEEDVRLVDLEVSPQPASDTGRSILVVLGECANDIGVLADVPGNLRQAMESTQLQLDETREALQSTIQELEISNEQGQTANEQLTAANEELQSTNEELQSVNEELYTVNFEYQSKIHELSDLNHDLDNLLRTSLTGVIFLDAGLNIRSFSDKAAEIINILPQDIGRQFVDLSHGLEFTDLAETIKRVKSLGKQEVRDIRFEQQDARLHVGVHPYKIGTDLAQGVVISFLDMADIKTYSPLILEQEVV